MSSAEEESSMQAGLSCNSLGAFFGGFFLGLGAEEFHELAQGLAGPVTWGAWPYEATGFSSKIARRKSILQSLMLRSRSASEIANFPFLRRHGCPLVQRSISLTPSDRL